MEKAGTSMLRPAMVLDMLESFTAFATQKGKRRVKIIARYQQVEGVNKILARVVAGQPRKGLIWHFQGSGKSLLMLFAARKLRPAPGTEEPYRALSREGWRVSVRRVGWRMTISFARHQFPPEIIRHAVWLYVRFTLSYRDVEDLLAERGLDVSYAYCRARNGVAAFARTPILPEATHIGAFPAN
jgi:hypothetical protein